jgi:hypothetical protein
MGSTLFNDLGGDKPNKKTNTGGSSLFDDLSSTTPITQEELGLQSSTAQQGFKGDSQYDTGLAFNRDQEALRARNQGIVDELGNGIARAALKVVPSTVQNLAYMADIEDYFNNDDVMGNAITRSMDELKGAADEAFPVYGGNKTLDWTNHEWLINQGSNLVESAGAFAATGAITGYGLGKGVQLLGNLAKAGHIPQALAMGTNAVLLNQAEGKASAVDVYRTVYENKLQEFEMKGIAITPEVEAQAKKWASEAGEHVLAINSIAIPLNLTSAGAFLRTPQLTRQLVKNITTKSAIKNALIEGGQEYVEESLNRVAEQEGLRKGRLGDKYQYDINDTVNDIFSKEGFEAGILGFVGGIAQTGASSIANRINGTTQANNERAEIQLQQIQKLDRLMEATGNTTLSSILQYAPKQAELINAIGEAAIRGDVDQYNLLNEASLQNQALYNFESGTTQKLEDMYKSISLDVNSTAKYGPEAKLNAEKAINQIKEWEKTYQDLAVRYQDKELVRDIFTNTTTKETIDNHIVTKRNEFAKLQAKKSMKDLSGIPSTQLDLELAKAESDIAQLSQTSRDLDTQFQEMIQPDYLDKKRAVQEAQRIEQEKIAEEARKQQELEKIQEETESPLEFESNNQINNKDESAVGGNESFPEELPKNKKFKEKTTKTNIAHKTYEQDPETKKDLIVDGKPVKTKVSIDLSSPSLAQAGEDLVFFQDNAYSGPETAEVPIAIALKSRPSEIIGYVHNEGWIENGVADSAKEKVRAETKAIREAVMNSNGPVEGKISSKTYNPKAINRDGNNFTHSLTDSFGAQSVINPNKFEQSEIVYVDGNTVYRGDNSLVTGVSFANIEKTEPGIKMMIPTPVKEEVYFTRVEPQTLKKLGQTKVISQLIEDYLDKKGALTLDELIDQVHKIDSKLDGEEGNVFALSNVDGKLQIQYGNSSFTEGEDFNKESFEKYLDNKPLNVDYKKLNSKEPYSTYKVSKDGNVIEDVKYPNYSAFLGQKVLKTNIIPEVTSNNERVFFAQPNIEIGLNAQEQAPTVSTEDQLVKSIEDGDIQAALGIIAGIDGKYKELAKALQGSVGNTSIKFSTMKNRGRYESGQIYINPKQNQEQLIEAIVHESVHAASVAKIEAYNRGEGSSLSESELKAIKALERLMQNASKPKRMLSKEESAGFSNLPEFVAMTLSNQSFQELLNNTPYNKDKSLLDRVFEVLSQLLGIDVKSGSALEQAAKDAMSLIKEESTVPTTGSYDLKFFERESSGDPVIDKYVELLDNQLRTLRDQRTEQNGEETDLKIWGIRKYQGTLLGTKNIFKVAKDQLRDINKTLDKKNVSFPDLVSTQDTLLAWNAISEILEAPEGSIRFNTQSEITGKVEEARKKWLKVAKKKLLEESKGNLSKSDLEQAKDINWTARETLSSNASPIALEAEMKKLMDVMSFRATEEITAKHKLIEEAVKKLGGKKYFGNLLQVDKNGDNTGNLISEFDADQEQEISKLDLNTKAGLKRLLEIGKSSPITSEIREKYKSDLEAFKRAEEERLMDKYKDISKPETQEKFNKALETNLKKWERENSPILRREAEDDVLDGTLDEKELKSMKGNKYFPIPTPQKKDPKYAQLTAKEKEFLDFYKSQFTEYLPYLAINTAIRNNTIPNLRRSFTEDLLKNPSKALIKGTYKKLINNIAVDEDSTLEYGNLDPTGQPIRRLKTRMLGNNLLPNEKSYDLEYTLKAWVDQAAGIKYKSEVEAPVKVAQQVLANMKAETGKDTWTGKPHLIEGGLENAQKRFNYTVDSLLYDIRKDVEGNLGKIDGKEVKGSKVADAVIKTMQANSLAFNPISAVTNWVLGTLTNFTIAAEGIDFNDKDMFRAFGTVVKAMNPKSDNAKKLSNVVGKLQILGEINPSNYGGKSLLDAGYWGLKKGEEFIQGQLTVAMLNNIKMSDGKTSLWDAFDVDGNIKPEFKDSGYGFEDGKATMKTVELSNKIRHVVANAQGDYDPRNPKLMKKKIIGRALSVYKNWLARSYQSRFGEERFDHTLGRTVKGRYKSIGKLSKDVNGLKNIFALSLLGKWTGAKTEGLAPIDEANLRLVARELTMISGMYLATLLLKGLLVDEDDEEDKAAYQFLLNTAFRIENELSFWTSPSQITEMIKNPVAPIRVIDDLNQFIGATEDFVLGDSEFADLGKKTLKLIPVANIPLKLNSLATRNFSENFGTKAMEDDED